jgi:hypothetical protein
MPEAEAKKAAADRGWRLERQGKVFRVVNEDPQARRWLWLIDRMTTLAIQLGLTPAARLRMNLPERRADEAAIFGTDA